MNCKLTGEKKIALLAALAATGNTTKACAAVDITRVTAWKWRQHDEQFAKDWEEAMKVGMEGMEDEAKRRAFDGVAEPIFYKGMAIDTIQKYSDSLAIFLLKGGMPDKYAERNKSEITNPDGSLGDNVDNRKIARLLNDLTKTTGQKYDDAEDLV